MQRVLAVCEPLGALVSGPRPLEGKSFYLDELKSHLCSILTNAIIRLGGKVESFLYKEVNVVITGNRDALKAVMASAGKVKGQDSPCEQRESVTHAAQRPGTPRAAVCGSRGKALLEKAIRNNVQFRGGVLSSAARYWGVKIVSVDQFLKVLEDLRSHRSAHTHRGREEKTLSERLTLRVIKAGSLKVDFVKVEDSSRKYRPLHGQSLDFPMLSYTRGFSPFVQPAPVRPAPVQPAPVSPAPVQRAPVRPGKSREVELSPDKLRKSEDPISSHDKPSATPFPKAAHKKKSLGFCECCQVKYRDREQHLQSDVHQRFVEDVNNYSVVDRLVADMEDVFSGCKEPHVDAPMTRLSSSSEGPPSESEQQRESEMEPNQEAEPTSQERVCDSSVPPQEPCVDVPPSTSLETKFLDEKRNWILDSETSAPSPCPLDPVEHTVPSPRVPSDAQKPSTLQELSEISPRTLASLNNAGGSSTCLKIPKQHQEDAMQELPSSRLLEREQKLLEDTTSPSPSFQSLPCSLPTTRSAGVNPRKRSRSFTLSPRTSKVRRTKLWSDPTNQNSGVDVRFDPLQQGEVEGHAEVNELKLDVVVEPDPSPDMSITKLAASEDRLSFRNDQHKEPCDESSELGPPQLYPFFHDDVYQNQLFLDPPKLAPSVASNASHLSQSFSSICIESALIPETFSLASSESDWDSGLLSRLAPPLHLQPKGGRCELDLGLLLQSSCSGMQDGSYASQLCSVLQPDANSSHAAFGDPKTIYRPMETMDRRIVQSLGV